MADKPVIVRLASGAEYGLRSEADAKRIYPNGVIIGYQDGTEHVEDTPVDVDTSKLTRDELNDYATRVGVDNPADMKSKPDVIKAIEAAKAGDAKSDGE